MTYPFNPKPRQPDAEREGCEHNETRLARAHLAGLSPERRAQLEREWAGPEFKENCRG